VGDKNAVEGQEKDTPKAEKIQGPKGGGVGSSKETVEGAEDKSQKGSIMHESPRFATDVTAYIEAEADEKNEIEHNLPHCGGYRSVRHCSEGEENLCRGVVDVVISQENEGMETGEGQGQQAGKLVDVEGHRAAGPDAGQAIGDEQAQGST